MDGQASANEPTTSLGVKLQHFVESLEPAERDDMVRIFALALAASRSEEVRGYAFLPSTHSTAPGGAPSAPGVQGTPAINAPSHVGDTGGNLALYQLTAQQFVQLYGPVQWTPSYF
jgi:hypothetical protein